jgi:hypothetical protein
MSTGEVLQRAHDYQKWLDDNGFGRRRSPEYEEGFRDGKAEALHDVKQTLLSQRASLTVALSTGEYVGLEDVLDIILEVGASKVASPTEPERRAKDGDR